MKWIKRKNDDDKEIIYYVMDRDDVFDAAFTYALGFLILFILFIFLYTCVNSYFSEYWSQKVMEMMDKLIEALL